MNSVIAEVGSFEKVIFESVLDTLAGGTNLDVTGYVNADGIIPAGTAVGAKDATTGLSPIIKPTGTPGTLTGVPIGLTHATIKLNATGNNPVGVVISGAYRKAALPQAWAAADLTTLKTAMPKLIGV